jgi:hypothetical protein
MTLKKLIKREILIIFTIWIYLILGITVYQNYTERKLINIIYESVKEWNPAKINESKRTIMREKDLVEEVDLNLSKRLSGFILLQVEANGEAWYVSPSDLKKYYLGRPQDAYLLIHQLGQEVSQAEIDEYLITEFPQTLAGRIVVDTENKEAFYVHPGELRGYFLEQPADTLRLMKNLGVGISNQNIRKIAVGELN